MRGRFGVLAPAYLNNAAGTLDIAPGGVASFPSISVATGFVLDNQGSPPSRA